jgi:Na+-transporting methylmalonyl-CoA/oxaloacetate decarboxylase gamma subunit
MNGEFLNAGLMITLVGLIVVFSALTLLYIMFSLIPKIIKIRIKSEMKKKQDDSVNTINEDMSAETIEAIAAAIYLYMNKQHDDESYNMTIKTISRRYSPWSSKLYSMNNLNKRY